VRRAPGLLVALALGGVRLAQGAADRAAFMRKARWGVMSHLARPFLDQLAAVGRALPKTVP